MTRFLIVFVLIFAITLGPIGIMTGTESDSGSTVAQSQAEMFPIARPSFLTPGDLLGNDDERRLQSTDDKVRIQSGNGSGDVSRPLNAARPSGGLTRVRMKNVDFHVQDNIILRIRELRGALLRTNRAIPPVFDNKRSFILRIDSGTVGISADTLTHLMNNHVFAYPGAPLKDLRITTKGNQIKMSGKMRKLIGIPFKITGNLSATAEGKIRIHPTSVKAAGIPVKGLMRLFGLELSELIKSNAARGVTMDDNDIILDPELVLPPPKIRGKITAVRIQSDEVIQSFGSNRSGDTRQASGSNYMYFWGGILRFGKLTMNNADLRIVDSDSRTTFDFSLDHYNRQLVAGYSKNTPNLGLVVFMPDYYKLRGASSGKSRDKEVGKGTSKPVEQRGSLDIGQQRQKPRSR